MIERLPDTWGDPDDPESQYAATTAELRALARWLRSRSIHLVLFLSPMSNSYREAIESGGLSGRYLRWRENVRSIANEEGAELIEADADAFLDPIAATCPPQRTREQCLFYDPVHFRPEVGAAILAAGTRSQPTGQAGRAVPHPLEPRRQPKTR